MRDEGENLGQVLLKHDINTAFRKEGLAMTSNELEKVVAKIINSGHIQGYDISVGHVLNIIGKVTAYNKRRAREAIMEQPRSMNPDYSEDIGFIEYAATLDAVDNIFTTG